MKHWTGQAAGRVLLTGATGLSAAGCCGNSRSRTAGVLRNTGWYYGNGFWRLRGLLEKRIGGAPSPGSRPAGGGRHARLLAGRGLRKGSAPAALKRDEGPATRTRTIFRTAESPSVAKTMKLVMSKIGPARLAIEDVEVSRVTLL